jgi:predicted transcriptional regulator
MGNKTYQPFIIEIANKFIFALDEEEFFNENDIDNTEIALTCFCDVLTEKFLEGALTSTDTDFIGDILTEEEFTKIITVILVKSTIETLKQKGLLNEVDDENGEGVYFLTENGAKVASEVKRQIENGETPEIDL